MEQALEQMDVTPEVITPEQEQVEIPQPEEVEPPKEDIQDKNWRAARARMEDDAREKRLQAQQIDILRQELDLIRRSIPQQKEPEEDISHFTDTEKQLYSEIKNLKGQLNQTKADESKNVYGRLRAQYSDFDDVVTTENVNYLKTNNAALAKAIAALKDDPFEQGIAAYDALKKTDWYQNRHTMQDKAKVEENSKKPVSVQAVRKQGPLSEANTFANGLTPELKKQLLNEMAQARKGA